MELVPYWSPIENIWPCDCRWPRLHWQLSRPVISTKLTSDAIKELMTIAEDCEALNALSAKPDLDTPASRTSTPDHAANSRPSFRRYSMSKSEQVTRSTCSARRSSTFDSRPRTRCSPIRRACACSTPCSNALWSWGGGQRTLRSSMRIWA